MADRWLKEVNKVDGVEGVFLASSKGKILGKLGTLYPQDTLEKLITHLQRIIAAFQVAGKNATEIEFYWEDRYVICKHSANFLLVTFCKSAKVLSLLRITLNVVLANILEDKKFAKISSSNAIDKTIALRKGFFESEEQLLISKLK